MFSSCGQDISREQQSRDLVSETIKSGAETMRQLTDKYVRGLSARKVLREEIVDSKLNKQSMERSERNARDAMHVIARQEDKAKETM